MAELRVGNFDLVDVNYWYVKRTPNTESRSCTASTRCSSPKRRREDRKTTHLRIAQVYDLPLQMEMERLIEKVHDETEAIDLSPQSIEAVKLEHRHNHPYEQ